jgi:hypothetical protein
MEPIKSQKVGDLDQKQPLLILPQAFVAQFSNADDLFIEYTERSATLLELKVVEKNKPVGNRRYRLVKHHGCAQVSVPRTWLRDKVARINDIIDVYQDADPEKLLLTLRRFSANGAVV